MTGRVASWPDNCTCDDNEALLRDGHRSDCPYLDGPKGRGTTEPTCAHGYPLWSSGYECLVCSTDPEDAPDVMTPDQSGRTTTLKCALCHKRFPAEDFADHDCPFMEPVKGRGTTPPYYCDVCEQDVPPSSYDGDLWEHIGCPKAGRTAT